MGPRKFQGNLGWWHINITWPEWWNYPRKFESQKASTFHWSFHPFSACGFLWGDGSNVRDRAMQSWSLSRLKDLGGMLTYLESPKPGLCIFLKPAENSGEKPGVQNDSLMTLKGGGERLRFFRIFAWENDDQFDKHAYLCVKWVGGKIHQLVMILVSHSNHYPFHSHDTVGERLLRKWLL